MSQLAIIIPTYNRKKNLKELLSTLTNQKNLEGKNRIISVVDGSSDGTVEMINNEFPSVTIIKGDGNWWWTKSINVGLKYAISQNCNEFLLMNDDTYVKDDFVFKLLKEYIDNGRGVLGALSVTSNKPNRIFYSGINKVNWKTAKFYKYHSFLQLYSKELKGIHKTLFIPGRGMLFDFEVLNKVGYFREDLFPQYFSDFDFSYTAYKAGFLTNISWNNLIYSHVDMTAKGSKTNSNFVQFFLSFFKIMSSNSFSGNFKFYRKHAGHFYLMSILLHYFRIFVSFSISKIKRPFQKANF